MRKQKDIIFIDLNDGSTPHNLQIIAATEEFPRYIIISAMFNMVQFYASLFFYLLQCSRYQPGMLAGGQRRDCPQFSSRAGGGDDRKRAKSHRKV